MIAGKDFFFFFFFSFSYFFFFRDVIDKPTEERITEILQTYDDVLRSGIEEAGASSVDDVVYKETSLSIVLKYESTVFRIEDIIASLKSFLAKMLNLDESSFDVQVAQKRKRSEESIELLISFGESSPAPQPPSGSSTGLSVSFIFCLIFAIFHLH